MTLDLLIMRLHAAELEYVTAGYAPGVAARLNRVAEARHAILGYQLERVQDDITGICYTMFEESIDEACGIVRSNN